MNCVSKIFNKKPQKLALKRYNRVENRFHLLELSTARDFCIGFYLGPSATENTKEMLTKANQILEGIPYTDVGLGWYGYSNAIKMGIPQDLRSEFGLLLYKTNKCYQYLDGKEIGEYQKAIKDFPNLIKKVKDGKEKRDHHEISTSGHYRCRCGEPNYEPPPSYQQVINTKEIKPTLF